MRIIAILCLLALGCAPRAYQPPVYPKLDKVEEQPLPLKGSRQARRTDAAPAPGAAALDG